MPRTLVVPLRLSSDGSFAITEDPRLIVRQRILDLLTTSKWERTMRPDHGCDLEGFLFTSVITHILATKAEDVKNTLNAGLVFGRALQVIMDVVPGTESGVRVTVHYVVFEGGDVETVEQTVALLSQEELQ